MPAGEATRARQLLRQGRTQYGMQWTDLWDHHCQRQRFSRDERTALERYGIGIMRCPCEVLGFRNPAQAYKSIENALGLNRPLSRTQASALLWLMWHSKPAQKWRAARGLSSPLDVAKLGAKDVDQKQLEDQAASVDAKIDAVLAPVTEDLAEKTAEASKLSTTVKAMETAAAMALKTAAAQRPDRFYRNLLAFDAARAYLGPRQEPPEETAEIAFTPDAVDQHAEDLLVELCDRYGFIRRGERLRAKARIVHLMRDRREACTAAFVNRLNWAAGLFAVDACEEEVALDLPVSLLARFKGQPRKHQTRLEIRRRRTGIVASEPSAARTRDASTAEVVKALLSHLWRKE